MFVLIFDLIIGLIINNKKNLRTLDEIISFWQPQNYLQKRNQLFSRTKGVVWILIPANGVDNYYGTRYADFK